MKKIIYLFALIAISLCFVQCEKKEIKQNGMHEGHEYVDLGLPSGLKWATYNVGATTPEGYGNYFAWGEVEPKDYYYWDTYKYSGDTDSTFTKYCQDKDFGLNGFVDNKIELDPEDDAASVNWGGKWRMPTKDEFDDLRYSCIWKWTTQNGVIGLLGTSRIEGYTDRTIFFPTAGMFWMDVMVNADGSEWGWYWSKSIDLNDPSSAQLFLLQTDPFGIATAIDFNYSFLRFMGASVRAVCP